MPELRKMRRNGIFICFQQITDGCSLTGCWIYLFTMNSDLRYPQSPFYTSIAHGNFELKIDPSNYKNQDGTITHVLFEDYDDDKHTNLTVYFAYALNTKLCVRSLRSASVSLRKTVRPLTQSAIRKTKKESFRTNLAS